MTQQGVLEVSLPPFVHLDKLPGFAWLKAHRSRSSMDFRPQCSVQELRSLVKRSNSTMTSCTTSRWAPVSGRGCEDGYDLII